MGRTGRINSDQATPLRKAFPVPNGPEGLDCRSSPALQGENLRKKSTPADFFPWLVEKLQRTFLQFARGIGRREIKRAGEGRLWWRNEGGRRVGCRLTYRWRWLRLPMRRNIVVPLMSMTPQPFASLRTVNVRRAKLPWSSGFRRRLPGVPCFSSRSRPSRDNRRALGKFVEFGIGDAAVEDLPKSSLWGGRLQGAVGGTGGRWPR